MAAAKKPMVPAKAKKVKGNPVALPKATRTKGKPAPLPKKPATLDDYLRRGLRPPIKGKGAPPDYDVITPDMGYTKPTKNNPPRKIKKPKK